MERPCDAQDLDYDEGICYISSNVVVQVVTLFWLAVNYIKCWS